MSHWRRPVQRIGLIIALGALAFGSALTAQSTANKSLRSPSAAVAERDPDAYDLISTKPQFLFFRLRPPSRADTPSDR